MVEIKELVLVSRNARDKIQVVKILLYQVGNSFVIQRYTGQYKGKMTQQPQLIVEKGKVKRSVLQQTELELNSILNKYLDKGYKRLDFLTKKKFDVISEFELDELVPSVKSDQSGNLKPMLAKSSDKVQNSVLQKSMYCSRKLNGVRMMVKWSNSLERPVTISRGGKNYNIAAQKITQELFNFLKEHPEYTLDGELYAHGHYLQQISGIARLETWSDRCEILEYWIYDLAIPNMIFEERLELLKEIAEVFKNSEKIKVLEHIHTQSWEEIQTLHNRWVEDGFEGLVARKPDKTYQFGKRGSDMIKVKEYLEDEFEIIDYSEGLRDEDFVFICQTLTGGVFEAKPVGTRALKTYYLENMNDIIGKKGTVKFFEYSKDGIPLQTVFQNVRTD